MTIITDPLFYMLALPGVLALGLSKGGFAGAGQMAIPLLAMIMPPLEAAAIMLPLMIVQDVNAVWVYRKGWNRRIIALMIPGSVVGVVIAGWLAAYISDAAVRVLVGVGTMGFVLYSVIGARYLVPKHREAGVAGGLFWGAVSGFGSTLCQAGGPPYHAYVMSRNLPKVAFVSTNTLYFAILNLLKVPPYLMLGQFSTKGIGTSLVLLPLAIAANQLGFWLVRRVSQEAFYKVILVLMVLISIELLRSGGLGIMAGH